MHTRHLAWPLHQRDIFKETIKFNIEITIYSQKQINHLSTILFILLIQIKNHLSYSKTIPNTH